MSIKVTWVAGEIQTVPVSWTSFSIEADVPYDKTLSSASFILTHDDVGQTIYYNDFTMTARATELNPEDDEPYEEEDVTYITRDDHSGVLPSSIQHENLAEPYLHEPKAHTHDADEVNITDSGDYFSGTEVETALQELGAVKHASGSDNQNLWETISSDSGSATANSETDTLTVSGSGGINTAVSGDTLTVGIADGAITEAKLDISNAPSDGQYLQYDSAAGKPKWDTIEPWTVNNEFQEAPDGVTTVFTVVGDSYISGGIIVTLNGQILNTNQWTEVDPLSGTLDLAVAPLSTDEIRWHGAGAGSMGGGSGTDELAKVSENDTTAGYLNGKLVAGDNITLTEGNDGGNETLTIASTASGGAWEIIEVKTIAGSAVQQVDFTSIAGNDYYEMALTWKILNSGNQANYYLFINGDSTITNYYRQTFACNASSISTTRANNSAILTESNNCWAAGEVFGIKKIGAKAAFEGRTNFLLTTNVRHYMGSYRYTPDLSGGEITALRIYGDQADCIGIGSEFVLSGMRRV